MGTFVSYSISGPAFLPSLFQILPSTNSELSKATIISGIYLVKKSDTAMRQVPQQLPLWLFIEPCQRHPVVLKQMHL